jgi:membrane protein DedA with SNARE-associated domain
MSLTEAITVHARDLITATGYTGAALLMALESMIAPVPSEAVMPFVGMAVVKGRMALLPAIVWTSIGSLIGSLLSYAMGYYGGKPLVMRVGKYLFLNEHHLDLTVAFFRRRGAITVFVARFVPVVRHFISVPAGMGRMPLATFCLFTVVGATMWNGLLLWAGYVWQDNVDKITPYYKILDAIVVVVGVIVVATWIYLHLRKPQRVPAAATDQAR